MRSKSEYTEELAEAIESVAFLDDTFFEQEEGPPQQQIVDKLADMLYASDMALDILHDDRYRLPQHLLAIEPKVRRLYNEVNELMKTLTD